MVYLRSCSRRNLNQNKYICAKQNSTSPRCYFNREEECYTLLMHLYFIRHGESTSNYGELVTGRQDVPLTEKGKEQARQAGKGIVAQNIKIDYIVSSSLARAHDTAKIIANEIGYPENSIEINDLVIERTFGSLEGTPKGNPATMTDSYIKEHGGEVDGDIRARVEHFIEPLRGKPGTILVVSHTGFGRRLRAVVQNISTDDSENLKNADLTDLGEI
jgi:broad specificity phosphatase PhoE